MSFDDYYYIAFGKAREERIAQKKLNRYTIIMVVLALSITIVQTVRYIGL